MESIENQEEIIVKTSPGRCVGFVMRNFVGLKNNHYRHREFLDIEADIIKNSLLYGNSGNRNNEVIFYFKRQVLAMLFNKELVIWPKLQKHTEPQKRAVMRTVKLLEKELKS